MSATAESRTRKGIPAPVAILLVALAAGAGAYGLWRFWSGLSITGTGSAVTLQEPPAEYLRSAWQGRVRLQQQSRQQDVEARLAAELNGADYVRVRPQGGWEAKGNHTRLIAQKNGDKLRITADSMEPDFVTADQRTLLMLRNRTTGESAVARQLQITPDQLKQLTDVPRGVSYPIDAGTRSTLEQLVTDWIAAPESEKPAKAAALTAAVRALEAATAGPTKQSIIDRTDKIKSIVSADQLKQFQNMGR